MARFDVIALDADDTLWHNERLYAGVQARFAELFATEMTPEAVAAHLYAVETRNMALLGYGIKAFTLSMIETALELSPAGEAAARVQAVLALGRGMLTAPVELLPQVAETVPLLARHGRLMVITKGDLLDQEAKVRRSGLGACFDQVEVLSQKSPESYARLLRQHGIAPERFLMVGNSLKSDVLPVLELGGSAVHIPYEITWLHEHAEPPSADRPGFYALEHFGQLPGLLESLE